MSLVSIAAGKKSWMTQNQFFKESFSGATPNSEGCEQYREINASSAGCPKTAQRWLCSYWSRGLAGLPEGCHQSPPYSVVCTLCATVTEGKQPTVRNKVLSQHTKEFDDSFHLYRWNSYGMPSFLFVCFSGASLIFLSIQQGVISPLEEAWQNPARRLGTSRVPPL